MSCLEVEPGPAPPTAPGALRPPSGRRTGGGHNQRPGCHDGRQPRLQASHRPALLSRLASWRNASQERPE